MNSFLVIFTIISWCYFLSAMCKKLIFFLKKIYKSKINL